MIDPESQETTNTAADLEVTVRHLREENAKLIQLLRSQGLLPDLSSSQNGKSADPHSSTHSQPASDSSSITFDHSDVTCTTNSIHTTNQVHHQHVNNLGSTNQQNYGGQTVHGNQSNITPNFNTVIQSAAQPFVQNNSNTLVQNNTNLIQPINLVNFNNVSLDSIQSFFASQNNVVYLPPSSTTTTTTSTTTSMSNAPSSILPAAVSPDCHQLHPNQELVPVIPKIRREQYESITRQSLANASSDLKAKKSRAVTRVKAPRVSKVAKTRNLLTSPIEHSTGLDPSSDTRLRIRKKNVVASSALSLSDVLQSVPPKQRKPTKRNLKSQRSENIVQDNAFAETISGFLENFNQELIESNLLPPTTEGNLLSDETTVIVTSNSSATPRRLDNIDLRHLVNGAIHTTNSMPTLEEFHERLEQEPHVVTHELPPIASFMSEEDMRLVEMTFDENTFLKQFDLEDVNIKLSVHSDQNLFATLLTQGPAELHVNPQTTAAHLPDSTNFASTALINSNVFTTLVPLGSQTIVTQVNSSSTLHPQEGVQLTARHIEPQQVATYESTTYQDILDDLVMVTDQDVLTHAQAAAAASDPSVVSADFSFALIAATNEMIKETQIEVLNDTTHALNQLQYFYPLEPTETHNDEQQQPPTTNAVGDLSSLLELEAPADSTSTSDVTQAKSPLPEFDPAPSPISDTLALSYNSLPQLPQPTNVSEPPVAEVVIDSGRLDQFTSSEKDLPASDGTIEDLLGEPPKDRYEMIEAPTTKVGHSLEKTFSRYQQKYQSNLKRRREQSLTIPTMKLKLNSIYPRKPTTRGKKCKVRSCPPIVLVKQLVEEEEEERPPLRITIRTPRSSADEGQEIRPTLPIKHDTVDDQMETERAASSTPVEQPVAVISSSSDPKNEIRSPSPIDVCPSQSSSMLHSGFLIDEHTPPSSITSMEHKHSPPSLLSTQSCSEKFRTSYSHLFTGDNGLDQLQNNETFTTPPPESDFHPHQSRGHSRETFDSFSPHRPKKKHQHRTSSATSSTSSRSMSTTDYALDTEALEPVSPTPLSKSKGKHSRSSAARAEISTHHHSSRHSRDQHSSKNRSSSSSSRSSKASSSRSSSNHGYRTSQESPHPPPPPPGPSLIDPYGLSYHHFAPRAPFFNFPFPHPYPYPHSSKHHRQYSSHGYRPSFPYRPHSQRQQQYNNSNYMSSREHHAYDR